jgi:hypothetical protein
MKKIVASTDRNLKYIGPLNSASGMQRGNAYWIVIVSAEEVAAPGFTAVSDAVLAIARSDAGIATVTWVASMIVVVR